MTSRLLRSLTIWVVLASIGSAGCREQPARDDPASDVTTEFSGRTVSEPPGLRTQSLRGPVPPVDGCIKGGTTRSEVTALLGPPDSISFGVWLYGRSELSFGYGVVVAFADHDENLQLCPSA